MTALQDAPFSVRNLSLSVDTFSREQISFIIAKDVAMQK